MHCRNDLTLAAQLRVNQICTVISYLLDRNSCCVYFKCDQVDDNIGLLVSELKRTGLWGRINLVLTSDHGMVQCSSERLILLDKCVHPDTYKLVDQTPVAAIIPLKGDRVHDNRACIQT